MHDDTSDRAHDQHDHKLFPPERAHLLDDESRLSLLSEETLAELLALDGNEDIADLGSGTGFWTNRVARWTTGTVYGVDSQSVMHEKHRAHGMPANVRLVLADLDALPLPPASLDRAFSVNAFHEAHAPEGLARLAAALRPGGRLVVVDWRRAEEAAETGPPMRFRLDKEEVSETLSPWFATDFAEDLNALMYAVVAVVR